MNPYIITFFIVSLVLLVIAFWYSQKTRVVVRKDTTPKSTEPATGATANPPTADKDKKKDESKDKKKAWYEEYPNIFKILVFSFCFIGVNLCVYLTFPEWYTTYVLNAKVIAIECILAGALALIPTKKGAEPQQEVLLRRTKTIATICLLIFLFPYEYVSKWFTGQTEKQTRQTRKTVMTTQDTPCVSGIEPEPGVEDAVRKVFGKQEDLIYTIKCYESGMRHNDSSTGKVLEHLNDDGSIDVGVFQINNRQHAALLEELKADIYKLSDNIRVAKHLYDKYGIEPWRKTGRVIRFELELRPKEESNFFIFPQHGKYVSFTTHPDNKVRQLFVYIDGSTEEIAHGPEDNFSPSKKIPLRQTMFYAALGAKITMQYRF